ncbi:Deoxyribonuclease NucA/NucB [Jiangella alkaliphila]|uniref:Deoxyribonuclease NucA/NucB n=2 Tax=Jiangella alkaliphila TaxID=419479 RepID=A0A1H2L950_9ACTN|nr:Deoxyribonuclease NucA/NucB [Jiangella alkaliphila]
MHGGRPAGSAEPLTYEDLLDPGNAQRFSGEVFADDLIDDGNSMRSAATPEECEEAWGDGPPYDEDFNPEWLWVVLSRNEACSLGSVGGVEPSRFVVYSAYQTAEMILSSNQMLVMLDIGPIIVSQGVNPRSDTLTIDVACVELADEVTCETSDGDGETRTLENWQNAVVLVTVNLEESTGFGDDHAAHSGLYISSDLHAGGDTAPPSPAPPVNQLLDFRCDKATYVSRPLGCVFHEFVPELVFDATETSTYEEAALHIQDALYAPERTVPNTGVRMPGRQDLDEPLRRNFYGNRSRTIVQNKCQELWPGYPAQGLECDEYPFASTYQNANYGPYSVRAIPALQNFDAGQVINALYRDQRLLDGDDFFVDVFGEEPNPGELTAEVTTAQHGYCYFETVGGAQFWYFSGPGETSGYYCYDGAQGQVSAENWLPSPDAEMVSALELRTSNEVHGLDDATTDCDPGTCNAALDTDDFTVTPLLGSESLPQMCVRASFDADYEAGLVQRWTEACIQPQGDAVRSQTNRVIGTTTPPR